MAVSEKLESPITSKPAFTKAASVILIRILFNPAFLPDSPLYYFAV